MGQPVSSGYAPVGGTDVYWESWGAGDPLVVVHGGYGLASDFHEFRERLAAQSHARPTRVIGIELDGHGHSRASGRPLRWETLGDDIACVLRHLELDSADLLGYSLGGGATLRCAIQHPSLVRRLVLVCAPHRRDGWHPEVRAGFDGMSGSTLFGMLGQSPLYAAWRGVAPDPDAFPALIDATGDLLRQPYDWSSAVSELPMPVLLAYGDADSISPAAAAEFFALLGGGQRDAGWDGSARPASRLAILPGVTHYTILGAGPLPGIVADFLA
jgi:pimeloyl-ACP methyl ester carboxylesterase